MRPPTPKSPDRAEAPRQEREEGPPSHARPPGEPSPLFHDVVYGWDEWVLDEEMVGRYEDGMDDRTDRLVGVMAISMVSFWFGVAVTLMVTRILA